MPSLKCVDCRADQRAKATYTLGYSRDAHDARLGTLQDSRGSVMYGMLSIHEGLAMSADNSPLTCVIQGVGEMADRLSTSPRRHPRIRGPAMSARTRGGASL
jgi:hypothetical protein